MFCRKCGMQINDDSVFCQGCGQPVDLGNAEKKPKTYVIPSNPSYDTPITEQKQPEPKQPESPQPAPISEEAVDKLVKQVKTKNFFKGLVKGILIVVLIGALCGIGYLIYNNNASGGKGFSFSSIVSIFKNPINLENYDKIQEGMTYDEVVEIFGGKEGEVFTEANHGNDSATVYIWRADKTANCTVEFMNGKVFIKAQAGLK